VSERRPRPSHVRVLVGVRVCMSTESDYDGGWDAEADGSAQQRAATATRAQALYRGHRARQEVKSLRDQRSREAAARAAEEKEASMRAGAATEIQRVVRGRQARRRVSEMREVLAESPSGEAGAGGEWEVKAATAKDDDHRWNVSALRDDVDADVAATRIQSVVRGHQARGSTLLRRRELADQRRATAEAATADADAATRATAATQVQRVVRGHQSRAQVRRVRASVEADAVAAEEARNRRQAEERLELERQQQQQQWSEREARAEREERDRVEREERLERDRAERERVEREERLERDRAERDRVEREERLERDRMEREGLEQGRRVAATRIQAVARGHQARRETRSLKAQRAEERLAGQGKVGEGKEDREVDEELKKFEMELGLVPAGARRAPRAPQATAAAPLRSPGLHNRRIVEPVVAADSSETEAEGGPGGAWGPAAGSGEGAGSGKLRSERAELEETLAATSQVVTVLSQRLADLHARYNALAGKFRLARDRVRAAEAECAALRERRAGEPPAGIAAAAEPVPRAAAVAAVGAVGAGGAGLSADMQERMLRRHAQLAGLVRAAQEEKMEAEMRVVELQDALAVAQREAERWKLAAMTARQSGNELLESQLRQVREENRALRQRVAEQDAELQAAHMEIRMQTETVDLVTRSRADIERKLHDSKFARPAAAIRPSASSAHLPPVVASALGSSGSPAGYRRK
jgi:hypothetical protein